MGRLSPIPAILGIEPDWDLDFTGSNPNISSNLTGSSNNINNTGNVNDPTADEIDDETAAQLSVLDQLAGSLADELTLQKDFMQGSVFTD